MNLRPGRQQGTMRKTKHRGPASGAADSMVAYNRIRIPKLLAV
jgi:hypothetical protein